MEVKVAVLNAISQNYNFFVVELIPYAKGQLISKCLFEVVVWTKYQRKYFQEFCHERLYRQGK